VYACWRILRYSYGIILWELATRQEPWSHIKEKRYIKFRGALSAALTQGERPPIPVDVVELQPDFVALIQQCWSTDPLSRPPFEFVVNVHGVC